MKALTSIIRGTVAAALLTLAAGLVAPSAGAAAVRRTPVVLFPAFHFTKLRVAVRGQVTAPGCPRSGSFEDWFPNPPGSRFSQICRDRLLTLRYTSRRGLQMRRRFSNQRGVTVSIIHYGSPSSTPFYEPLYRALVDAGYRRGVDIRVAGYDSRLTPDMGGFLRRTKRLIERTYRSSERTPVRLVGHSNGPLYAQYLLTHTSARWKHRYIQGFTDIAGNLPGQGALYPLLFTGLNVGDFSFPATRVNARSSGRMYLTAPSSYMSAADPRIFDSRETVVRVARTGRRYTPATYRRLFRDAGLRRLLPVAQHYIGFVRFTDAAHFPNVDVRAEKGSGIPTAVGIGLRSLRVGQVVGPRTPFFLRDGDVNQEDITNSAVRAWRRMRCFRFQLVDNPGVDHFSLPSDPHVLARLLADLRRPRSRCG
jgi:lecithin-cholesterol acyltransferase